MPDSPDEVYGEIAAEYAEVTALDDIAEEFHALLESFVDGLAGPAVLDAGCGPGRDCAYFHEQGLDPVGVDVADGMLEYARTHQPGQYLKMDVRCLGFPPDSFDGVWCPASVFFLQRHGIETALSEFASVLRPGGVARIGFKLGDGTTEVEKWGTSMLEYHVSEDEARRLLRDAGFRVRSVAVDETASGVTFANCYCEPVGRGRTG